MFGNGFPTVGSVRQNFVREFKIHLRDHVRVSRIVHYFSIFVRWHNVIDYIPVFRVIIHCTVGPELRGGLNDRESLTLKPLLISGC